MSTKTGWCMDARQYALLDDYDYARKLHTSCRNPESCPCECHGGENLL